jgi:signal transduction histidine kinase
MLFSSALFSSSIGPSTRKSHGKTSQGKSATALIIESAVWLLVIAILIGMRAFSVNVFTDESTLWLAGLIIAFALTYYLVISRHFNEKQRHYIKDVADVIFIGILSTLAKDYSVYFFSLYILPIAGAAFALNILNSLLIAMFASLFIAANLILNTQLAGGINPIYLGSIQISFLLLLTFFTRALAIQLRDEHGKRAELEQKLARADQKLEDVEAIEQEFITTTTHQLNTPLSIIRGYSSLLLDQDAGKLNTKQKKYAREINEGSQRLASLIEDLLSIAHIDNTPAPSYTPIILQQIVDDAIYLLKEKSVTRSIAITTKFPAKHIHVMGSKAELSQAVINLIDNAIKYSEPNSTINVGIEQIRTEANGYQGVITVTDHGIGIPKREQGRIFQRFYRASNSKERDTRGSGLGLYIVKRLVEEHNGKIAFSSKDNMGTTFTITLPVAHVHQAQTKKR